MYSEGSEFDSQLDVCGIFTQDIYVHINMAIVTEYHNFQWASKKAHGGLHSV